MGKATLAAGLEAALRRWPDRPAITLGEATMSYKQLAQAAASLASAYRRLDIAKGDRVICQVPNRPEHLIALAAAWAMGAVHVGADHHLSGRELAWLAVETEAAAVIFAPLTGSADPFGPARAVQAASPATRIVVAGGAAPWPDALSFATLASADGNETDRVWSDLPRSDDAAVILFTSGTTGRPKGAVGLHGNLLQGWSGIAERLDFGPDDVHLAQLPLAHGFGLSMAVMALLAGGHLVLQERFSPEESLQLIGRHRISVLNGTPAHFRLLIARRGAARHDLSSLRTGVGSAARFPSSLLERIFRDLGMNLLLLYGSSEGSGVSTTDREEMLAGSVGRPEPGYVAILGEDGAALGPEEVGEIAFWRQDWPVRYWRQPRNGSPVAAQGDDGWYRTGDLGRLDSEGRLYVLGRKSHQIDRGGMKVDPGEVEELLLACPGVSDGAVVGTPDDVLGEVVCACVVAEEGLDLTLADLQAALAHNLARFKLPEELCLVPSIPRTPLGKVDRAQLQAVTARRPRERRHAR